MRIFWVSIVIIIIAFLSYDKVTREDAKNRAIAERQAALNEVKASIKGLKKSFNANDVWIKTIANGEDYRSKPILSIELEDAWVKNSPILFPGSLRDIARHNKAHYQTVFAFEPIGRYDSMFVTILTLALKSDKVIIDEFITNNKGLLDEYGFNNRVMVAAKIDKIESSMIVDHDIGLIEIKTGHGELLGIVFTGDDM